MAEKAASLYGLKITPRRAQEAVELLAQYVAERAQAVEVGKLKTANEATRMQRAIDLFKEEVADRVKNPAEELYNRLRFTTLPGLMDSEGITSIGVEGVGRVHLQDDISIKVEDKENLATWLIDNQLEDLIKETVNAQTLAAHIRQRMRENAERVSKMRGVDINPKDLLPLPPPNICTIKPIVRAVITKE